MRNLCILSERIKCLKLLQRVMSIVRIYFNFSTHYEMKIEHVSKH